MKPPSILMFIMALISTRATHASIITRHCECQSPLSKLKDLSEADIDAMLSGTLAFPKDNSTTSSCCSEVNPAGNVNGPGDKFENVCSVQKDLMAGTSNAAVQFLICCYFRKGMIGDCYD
ncbi:hypothetical protein LA080_011740 [Diaporthe eres]|uniref:Hydrophobin n=1 Tax=Diaporthe vaccinii TaxID=105482 RepID=A0ABR4DXB0_9PEZI|nr:hypothetical protein LA080_011740 [Diaporthe eres]